MHNYTHASFHGGELEIQKVRPITNRTKDNKKEEKEPTSSITKDQGPDRRAADTIEEGAGSGEDLCPTKTSTTSHNPRQRYGYSNKTGKAGTAYSETGRFQL